MRKTRFAVGEYYHIYNRGVDKRVTFMDEYDIQRFYDSLDEFNTLDPIGSIYENSFVKKFGSPTSKLVRSRSSWEEYTNEDIKGICKKDIILEQFRDVHEYKKFALSSLESIIKRKEELKDIGELLLE